MAEPHRTNRRQFLTGRSAISAVRRRADQGLLGDGASTESHQALQQRSANYVTHFSKNAMACEFQVILNGDPAPESAEAAMQALELVDLLEDQLSVYRPDSEISQINQRASRSPMVLEPRLFQLLERAVQLSIETGGAFDITAATLSKVWGFHRREGRVPSPQQLEQAMQDVGSRWIQLDDKQQSIQLMRSGMEINLGGIGKGYALDRCAELMCAEGADHFLIHGGQSSVLARGDRAGAVEQGRSGWTIGLRHPVWPERRLAEIQLCNSAVGTSGTARQSFYHQGKRYGHILDPRSGQPADRVLASTVVAPTAAQADALATAFYVMGPEQAIEFCQAHPPLATLLVTASKRPGRIELYTHGLDDHSWRLLDSSAHVTK